MDNNSSIAPGDKARLPKTASRMKLTTVSCYRCRLAKAKCTGERPACTLCTARGLLCEYEVTREGVSRIQELQRQLGQANQELELLRWDLAVKTDVIQRFQTGSEQEAIHILARLRVGHSLEEIAAKPVKTGQAL
ncbi:hypothetical protein LTR62_001935 [Meristemomyces frigidus]|uniref:Zn(2)-C6 fungal-type domain-containing protein n=1 Tax=Meristemomyces frigidus TaxID=1508187 RepID=A0AAN7T7Z6_9PEZI|nr:hypothetical protein LTR62_001935 [Meristemomyces frigidus]